MVKKVESSLIVKSNELVEASYKLTAGEQKIILKLVSVLKPEDKEFQRYKFKIKEFIDLLGIKDQSKYIEIPKIAEGLMKKILTIREKDGPLKVAWISAFKHYEGEGVIELEFSPYLKPYLLQLKSRFTSYSLKNAIQLKSGYSLRIYELLKQYAFIGERVFELSDLRYILAIEDEEYPLYADFKRYIIKQAQKEINLKTDISFDFEEIKTGKKVTSIKFIISSASVLSEVAVTNYGTGCIPQNIDSIKLLQAIIEENLTELELASVLNAANGNVALIKEKYEIAKGTSNIKNIVAWLISAVKNDFKQPVGKKDSGHFNNFDQRNTDFDSLEKKLLGWDKVDEENVV